MTKQSSGRPAEANNIHCYYKTIGQGQMQGECPEFHVSTYGSDRDACESSLVRMVGKKNRDDSRCFTHHATGEEPK